MFVPALIPLGWFFIPFFFSLACRVFDAAARRLCLAAARGSCSLWLWLSGVSLWWPLLWSTGFGSKHRLQELQPSGAVVVAHGLSCSVESRIFSDQELNPSLLLRQVDSLLSSHHGSSFLSLTCIFQAVIGSLPSSFLSSSEVMFLQASFSLFLP